VQIREKEMKQENSLPEGDEKRLRRLFEEGKNFFTAGTILRLSEKYLREASFLWLEWLADEERNHERQGNER
jgi:hypothetical protein